MAFDTDSVIIYDPLGGAATNGGGFAASRGGARITSPIAYTDLVIDGATSKLSSVTRPFTNDDRGNFICITGGTGFTPNWYEITTVFAGVATCDKAIGTLSSTGGTGNLGGYIDKLTDALMELSPTGLKHQVWATAAMVLGESIDIATLGSTTTPIYIEGRASDGSADPQGANRPTITCGANTFSLANHWRINDMIFTSTAAAGVTLKLSGSARNCKFSNTSETAGRKALTAGANLLVLLDCELSSTNGFGIAGNVVGLRLVNCYIHDSATGWQSYEYPSMITSIIESCSTTGVDMDSFGALFINNTIDTCVDGIDGGTSAYGALLLNNILSNHISEGMVWAAERRSNWWDYNNFFNCGTDRTNVAAGPNDNAVDPGYTNAAAGDFSTGANVDDTGFGIRLGVG